MDLLKARLPCEIYDSLLNANIKSLTFIITLNKCELAQIAKINLDSADQVLKEAANITLSGKLRTANEMQPWQRISTGCQSIDSITNGGIAVRGITEIVGCSGVGKTQLCLQLSLMTQLPVDSGGLEKNVVYICTEDVFPIKRLSELAHFFQTAKYKANFEDNIFIEHISDFVQLKACLSNKLPKLASVKKLGLVIIDSVAGVFRSENCNVNYLNRSQEFVVLVSELNKLSLRHGFAVICVNQVTDNPNTGQTEPCLGLSWSNLVTCRFKINRFLRSEVRDFEVAFAPDLPNNTCKFKIAREGLVATD